MLEVKNLKKSFGEKKVLDDISFSLKEGECLGIVGQSGCGKSTLVRLISRFIDVDDGSNMLRLFDSCMFNGTPKSEIEEIVKYNNDNKLYNLSIKSYGEQIKYIKKTISNSMLFYAFFGIALLAFSIIGMTGTMIVRVIDNLYEYTVNLMCGATLNDIYDRITYEFFITFFIGIMGCLYFFGYTLPTLVALLISQISYTGMRVYLRRHLDFEVLTKTMARK